MARDGNHRPSEIAAVFNAAFDSFEDGRRCLEVTRVLGSMLVFDFGTFSQKATRNGATVSEGSGLLSIDNAYWWVGGTKRRINSEGLGDESFEFLRASFVGRELLGAEANSRALRLLFQDGLSINVDLTNAWGQEADEDVCRFRFEGMRLSLLPHLHVKLRSEHREYRQAA